MKRFRNTLTTLVILQVAMVILLGVLAVLMYQSQSAVHQLRSDLAKIEEEWGEDDEDSVAKRLAALELRAGMRDPGADQAAAALQQQMAEANALRQRFDELRQGGTAPGITPSTLPPSPVPAQDQSSDMLEGLTPTEQAVAKLPVIAEILTHDSDWDFYTIDKGQLDDIKEEQEFGVRNKDAYEILANVKISRLYPEEAVVIVVNGTQKEGVPAPAPGDVLIDTSQMQ